MERVQRLVVIGERRVRQILATGRPLGHGCWRRIHQGVHPFVKPVAMGPFQFESFVLDKAIAVAGCALMKFNRMNHAVAVEGVVGRLAENVDWIGAHAQEVPLQIRGDRADHLHIRGVTLLGHGTEVAVQKKVRGGRACEYFCHACSLRCRF